MMLKDNIKVSDTMLNLMSTTSTTFTNTIHNAQAMEKSILTHLRIKKKKNYYGNVYTCLMLISGHMMKSQNNIIKKSKVSFGSLRIRPSLQRTILC